MYVVIYVCGSLFLSLFRSCVPYVFLLRYVLRHVGVSFVRYFFALLVSSFVISVCRSLLVMCVMC